MTQPPMRPSGEIGVPAGSIFSGLDERVAQSVASYMRANHGVPRPRALTMTIPLAGALPPGAGWLTSVFITYQQVRFAAWMINALTPGAISLDLQISYLQSDPLTPPVLTSIVNNPANTPATYIEMNGYTAASADLSGWVQTDITGPFVLHVIVNTVDTLAQAVLGIHLTDLQGKTIHL